MLEILLVRHGQTDWNAGQKVMGAQPIPLNSVGCAQAERLAGFLSGVRIDRIISSTVLRAKQTAEIIVKGRDGISVENDPGLDEIDYGEWVNLKFSDLGEKFSEMWRRYRGDPTGMQIPGGELMEDVTARVGGVIERVRNTMDEGRVMLVSHADIIKIAILHVMKIGLKNLRCFSIDNCAMILIRFYPDFGPRLVLYNAMNGFGKDM